MGYAYRGSKSSSVSNRFARTRTGQRKTNSGRNKAGKHGQYINPQLFVKKATVREDAPYEPTHSFADFALNPTLKANLTKKGFVKPSPIQDQALPVALAGRDVIGIADTGTGKTAAFSLPLMQKLMDDRQSAALVVAPTRELAQQIEQEIRQLGQGSGIYGILLIGGANMGAQLRRLQQRPRLVIGTPGRIQDHLRRGSLKLHSFNLVVLDEVDRMLDMGFVKPVTEIMQEMSPTRQSLFFSATMDTRVRELIGRFSNDPATISISAGSSSDNVHQDVVRYRINAERMDKLHDVLLRPEVQKTIIFDGTQRGVEQLSIELASRGFVADSIHGGKTQGQRNRALTKFKAGEVKVLVATDVAARGIDVSDISHVINYSLPNSYDDYIHRVGRAGRAGREGFALTFITD